MALDFYKVSDKAQQDILFSLNDEDIEILLPVFKQFKNLTGITIDQYGKSRISVGHFKLISSLTASQSNLAKIHASHFKRLYDIFQIVDDDVIAIGD